ncbi:hypothetical protein ACQ3G7_17260 [Kosakonia oryzendophytica]|uniref:hypothetical protein n=1 Tax=Kosakonia oryzendophytica TaxID=1005665 RepID=UPI003D34C669
MGSCDPVPVFFFYKGAGSPRVIAFEKALSLDETEMKNYYEKTWPHAFREMG